MQKVMDYFKQICKIPHCSFETDEMREFLINHAKKNGFDVKVDEAGNIYACKGEPKVCLQSHYDMVCVGEAPNIELVEKDGFLSAKNSTLGADDGIGVAISMVMMEEFNNLEVIFTNNEEVGLWGAARFEFKTKSKKLLNLDSEEDFRVSIGCAGSVDMYATCKIEKTKIDGYAYKLSITDFPGGHSGTEIDKNIPNATKFLVKFIKENSGKLGFIDGGERRNSIPSKAYATVVFDKELRDFPEYIKSEFVGKIESEVYINSDKIVDMICIFSQGVRSFNKELKIPEDSINLSTVKEKDGVLEVLFFARSMSKEGLENSKFETKVLADTFGFEIRNENQTTPWKPVINDFSEAVLKSLRKFNKDAEFAAVHAGLECGVFIGQDDELLATSIGPNIFSPHSVNERLEIDSVPIIMNAVRDLLKELKA